MLSRNIKIVSKEIFEMYVEDTTLKQGQCLIRVNKGAICRADIRYYKGEREEKILGLKYPMSLIHEAIGTVLKSYDNTYKAGDRVILIPNLCRCVNEEKCKNKVCKNKFLGENYCKYAKFASSNCDGFSKEIISWPKSNIIKIDESISDDVAVFSELISVCESILRRIKDIDSSFETVCIFGDGIVGFILSNILHNIYKKKVIIVGKHEDKMMKFPCEHYLKIDKTEKLKNQKIDVFVECVGGKGMNSAVQSILDVINPGGKIVLSGVSEEKLLINSRSILEKGLVLTGSTRSNISDFKKATEYLKNKEFYKYIKILNLGEKDIRSVSDYYNAFFDACTEKRLGKYILNFIF
ncbi:alcohol dehydrogenase catalytic domain-containing protein [Clostridium sp. BJN0001]|uniref:alcohol dehydrogenase catalytic domain-containing protein n=1 Tax=Clostridium sp. BJN0001 TaxID=2930219 RepID=UPI001FD468E3|nr:alcohol dehydrogenase catalytic domain-containing protein [Clostridium sp. BJN0001]